MLRSSLVTTRPFINGLRQPMLLGPLKNRFQLTDLTRTWLLSRSVVSRAAKKVVNQENSQNWETPTTPLPQDSTATSPPLTNEERLKLMENHPAVRKFPKFMRKYAVRFVNAPISHVTSFLIIHEVTAIAPLFALWSLFHHFDFIPPGLPDWLVTNGVNFVKVLAERNHWDDLAVAANTSKIILEGAAAYAVVKVLLPVRVAFSLFLMPWFAKVFVIPVTNLFSRLWPKKKTGPKREDEGEEVLNQQLSGDVKKKDINNDSNRPSL